MVKYCLLTKYDAMLTLITVYMVINVSLLVVCQFYIEISVFLFFADQRGESRRR